MGQGRPNVTNTHDPFPILESRNSNTNQTKFIRDPLLNTELMDGHLVLPPVTVLHQGVNFAIVHPRLRVQMGAHGGTVSPRHRGDQ